MWYQHLWTEELDEGRSQRSDKFMNVRYGNPPSMHRLRTPSYVPTQNRNVYPAVRSKGKHFIYFRWLIALYSTQARPGRSRFCSSMQGVGRGWSVAVYLVSHVLLLQSVASGTHVRSLTSFSVQMSIVRHVFQASRIWCHFCHNHDEITPFSGHDRRGITESWKWTREKYCCAL